MKTKYRVIEKNDNYYPQWQFLKLFWCHFYEGYAEYEVERGSRTEAVRYIEDYIASKKKIKAKFKVVFETKA